MKISTGVQFYRRIVLGICFVGILISLYAYHVETSKELNESYTAMCDINEYISCTKAFSSAYGKGFGLIRFIVAEDSILNQPNSIFGVLFYLVQLFLDQRTSSTAVKLQIAISGLANLGSVYLAYILAFVLHDFCFVCVTMYVLNGALLYCNFKRRTLLSKTQTMDKKN